MRHARTSDRHPAAVLHAASRRNHYLRRNPRRPAFRSDAQVAGSGLIVLLVAAALAYAGDVHAACNLIPGTEKSFSAALGATNRPYAAPGERLELQLRACDASPGFLPAGADHVVTLVFKPTVGRQQARRRPRRRLRRRRPRGVQRRPGVVSATCVTATPGDARDAHRRRRGDRRLVVHASRTPTRCSRPTATT